MDVKGRRLLSSHRRHELRCGDVRRIRGRMLHALHPKCDLQQHQAQQRKRPSLGRLLAQKRCRHRFHTRSAAGVVRQREDFLQGEPHASSRHRDVRTCCSSSPSRPHAALHAICAIDTLPCEVAARNSHHPRASPSQPSPPPPIVTPSGYVERSLVSNSGGGDGGGGFWLRADYSYDAIDGRNVGHGQQYAGFVDVCGTRCTASSSFNHFMFAARAALREAAATTSCLSFRTRITGEAAGSRATSSPLPHQRRSRRPTRRRFDLPTVGLSTG